jgi:hypothetical protein
MDPIITFSKQVKSDQVHRKDIIDPKDISKIDDVIQKLERIHRVEELALDELELRTNPKKWIKTLITSYPDLASSDSMENLLHDFTDSMQTRMREETKYALGLIMKGKLILCHSIYGEETITPEWKIIPRMLDTDNVLRYVSFLKRDSGSIRVKFWEREATNSFIEWLGLPRKQAFMFGGKYRISCEIDSVVMELQLTDDEMETWLSEHPEFREGRINLPNPIQVLNISEVKVGRKNYQNPEDFLQDYEAEKQGVAKYQEEYQRAKESFLPLLMTYYDEKYRLVMLDGDNETNAVSKSTPGFDILFADGSIKFRASYIDDLCKRIVNGESIRLFHAGMRFKIPTQSILNIDIFNDIDLPPVTQTLLEYYEKTNLQDRTLDLLIKFVVLSTISEANRLRPIAYVCNAIGEGLLRHFDFNGNLTKTEDTIIEFKSREVFTAKPKDLSDYLVADLNKKLKKSRCKVYVIGVEDDGRIDPLPASRLKSDRIESLKHAILNEIDLQSLFILPIINDGQGLILIIVLATASPE